MVEEKTCQVCRKDLPLEMYNKNNYKKSGLQDQCRSCSKEGNDRRRNLYKRKYPVPSDICVYAFKEGDEMVYIGSSNQTAHRMYEHYHRKPGVWKGSELNKMSLFEKQLKLTWHILWYGDDIKDAQHQEKMLIQIHQPKFNKIKYKNYEG